MSGGRYVVHPWALQARPCTITMRDGTEHRAVCHGWFPRTCGIKTGGVETHLAIIVETEDGRMFEHDPRFAYFPDSGELFEQFYWGDDK